MKSLRRQLLVWLLPLIVFAGVAATLGTYWMFGRTVSTFMDNQLRVFADSHAENVGPVATLRTLTAHNVEKGDLIVQIWNDKDGLLASSWPQLPLPRLEEGFHDFTLDESQWRVYTLRARDRTVQSVQSLVFREGVIRDQALGAGLPLVVLLPVFAAMLWLAIRMTLRRLEHVAHIAATQDENTLSELPIAEVPQEIRPLVFAVNNLLGRLREAFHSQRRFVQDAAHELRTPVTAMSLQLENLKSRIRDPAAADQLRQLEAGLARTKRLVEQLLRLARQEAPSNALRNSSITLGAFLKTAIAESMALADHRGIDLGFAGTIDATVTVNPDELSSLVHNLIDNALRYTPKGGVVDVIMQLEGGIVTVDIVDSGPGIAEDTLPRVFDRFYRIEGTDTEGSGLGLAIARNAAERNHIELQLRNRSDASGLVARLRFPDARSHEMPELPRVFPVDGQGATVHGGSR